MSDLALTMPDEFLERVAQRAAELVNGHQVTASDGWLRGAQKIAHYIDCPVSRVYSLSSAGRIPVEHDGSSLIARKSELDRWVRGGGGKRP